MLTERLRLRPSCADDAAFVARLLRDEAVRRYLGGAVTPDRLDTAVAACLKAGTGEAAWLVEIHATGEPIGLLSLTSHKDGADVELSYQFHPSAWGKGYATEASRSALHIALDVLCLERVIAETQAANLPSRRLLERLGMTELRCVTRFGCRQVIYTTQG